MLTPATLVQALALAMKNCASRDTASKQRLHASRSREWVACLGTTLAELHPGEDTRVFTKHREDNREEFGLNEMLYDVCICETATCASAHHRETLRYITRAIWQVESEFQRDSFAALKDFNKLVIGSATNKLFIGPRLTTDEMSKRYRQTLLAAALRCPPSAVFLAHVPHPDAWATGEQDVSLWQVRDGAWMQVD